MGYKVSFVTRKQYSDGTERIIIKDGYNTIVKAQRAKQEKKYNKEKELNIIRDLEKGQASIFDTELINKKKEEFNRKYLPSLKSAVISMHRAKQALLDILQNNEFDFFVTLTFDGKKVNRMDDIETRRCLYSWARLIKREFPMMYYVIVPEYHKKGGLHYHILLGGVTAEQLGLIDSGKTVRKGRCKGQPIYNITKWSYGFSTATKVLDNIAVKYYLSKYLTKGKIDPRFYGKKRYYTSQNISRPEITKFQVPCHESENIYDYIKKDDYIVEYEDKKKEYKVLLREIKRSKTSNIKKVKNVKLIHSNVYLAYNEFGTELRGTIARILNKIKRYRILVTSDG